MTITKHFMRKNCGCYSQDKLASCSFMKLDIITLQSIAESEIPIKDKYWFFCTKIATKEENKQIAIAVAEMVLPIYESRYPNDKRPHEAIEAAKQYIAGHITREQMIEKRRAAYTAPYAYDAYSATAAAYSAAAAAYSAAYSAAYYAYDAYTTAAYDIQHQLSDYIINFAKRKDLQP